MERLASFHTFHFPGVIQPRSPPNFLPTASMMKLIGSQASPYVRKVRIVLAEKKLDYRFELEDVWSANATIAQYNPLGKVPCLIMEDGGALFDSRVIVEYLDGLSPNAKLIPQNGRPRIEVKTWEALADGLCDAAIIARLEQQRAPAMQDAAVIDRQFGKIDAALIALSQGLDEKPWCASAGMTLADIATVVALDYLDFRFKSINWRDRHANLVRLHEKCGQRQSFIDTAPRSA